MNYPDVASFSNSNSYESDVMPGKLRSLRTIVCRDLLDVVFDYSNRNIKLLVLHSHVIDTHFSNIIGFPNGPTLRENVVSSWTGGKVYILYEDINGFFYTVHYYFGYTLIFDLPKI